MLFNKENVPEFLKYLSDNYRNYRLEYLDTDSNMWETESSLYTSEILSDIEDGIVFRVKPKTRIIYSPTGEPIECPAPLSEKPEESQKYWYEDITEDELYSYRLWHDDEIDNKLLKAGLAYAIKEDARVSCKARHFGQKSSN